MYIREMCFLLAFVTLVNTEWMTYKEYFDILFDSELSDIVGADILKSKSNCGKDALAIAPGICRKIIRLAE